MNTSSKVCMDGAVQNNGDGGCDVQGEEKLFVNLAALLWRLQNLLPDTWRENCPLIGVGGVGWDPKDGLWMCSGGSQCS